MFTKLEQRSWIKIEVERGRRTQECFQGLHEACGDEVKLLTSLLDADRRWTERELAAEVGV